MTLIELLVVLAVISIVASLALIALTHVRASSQIAICQNNLRSFGMAALSFESAKRRLPPGTMGFGKMVSFDRFMKDEQYSGYRKQAPHTSFQGVLLLYMEQANLSDKLAASFFEDVSASSNRRDVWFATADGFVEVSTNSPAYTRCPTAALDSEINSEIMFGSHPVYIPAQNGKDAFSGETQEHVPESLHPLSSHHGTNYLGCSGIGAGIRIDGSGPPPEFRGAMSAGFPIRFSDLRDGASNTYLLGEHIGFRLDERRFRMSWLIGGLARARGDVPFGEDERSFLDLPNLYLGDKNFSPLGGFGSLHDSVVNFALADGSVTSVAREVDWRIHLRFAAIADRGLEVWP